MKGGNLPGVVCRTSVGPFLLDRRPTPFEAVMPKVPDRLAVPGDDEVECSFVAQCHRGGAVQEKSLGALAFAMPFVFPREGPNGIGGVSRAAIFLDQTRGNGVAHGVVDRGGMFTAQTEGFEKALAERRHVDPEFAQAIVDDGRADGRMLGRLRSG